MQTCLITGGAGFIGSHLVEACLEGGLRVLVLDNLSTGKKENLPLENPMLEFIEGDIGDRRLLGTLRERNPDIAYVFHLAAVASVTRAMQDPVGTHAVNYQGILLLLETFRNSGLRKFVFASSAAVYGDNPDMPLREDALPKPMSPYGVDKLGGEYILRVYNDAFGVPTVSCRFFNVFGERQDPSSPYSGVISIFFDRAMSDGRGQKASLTIDGDGEQTRDFVYVKDVVSALLFCARKSSIRGEVFNIGYGRETTILGLAQRINALLGGGAEICFGPNREGDIRHSLADATKLLDTGFSFSYDFGMGLERLARWLNP